MRLEPSVPALIKTGRLQVDFRTGSVFSKTANNPKKPMGAKTAKGYLRICLVIDGKQAHALVHRVIWCAAYGPVPDKMQIDHINGNKSDNRLENLECVTGLVNMKRAALLGLTSDGRKNAPRDKITGRFLCDKPKDGWPHAAGRGA